jgi:mediator of RNA polymerase II transcription subunit 5
MTAQDQSPSPKQWHAFIRRCLQLRVRADQFDGLARELAERAHVPGGKIALATLGPHPKKGNFSIAPSVDPLVPVYVERLLGAGIIDAADVLVALLHGSRHQPAKESTDGKNGAEKKGAVDGNAMDQDQPDSKKPQQQNPPELEETIFYRMAKHFGSNDRPKSVSESRRTIYVLIQWMTALVQSGTNDSMMAAVTGGSQQMQLQTALVREALAMLAIAVLENGKISMTLDMAVPKSMYSPMEIRAIRLLADFV